MFMFVPDSVFVSKMISKEGLVGNSLTTLRNDIMYTANTHHTANSH